MLNDSKRDELLEKLNSDGKSFFIGGLRNKIIDLSLTVSTVLASLVATGLAVARSGKLPAWILPVVAAIPAATASIQKIVGVRERSHWYFMYAAQVRALAMRLKFADAPNVEELANERAKLEVKMEAEWTKIGSSVETIRRKK